MTYTHTYRGVVWLDLESPTEDEIANLVKRYELHPLVGEELKNSSSLAKIDFYENYILVVLTLPVRIRNGNSYEIVDREVDFVVGKNFLITSREGAIEQLEYFAKIFEANNILNKDEKIEHAAYLFYYMVKRIYSGMQEDLGNIKDSLLDAENKIFKGNEKTMVEKLSNLSRELIDFSQTANVHKEIWEDMITHSSKSWIDKEFNFYINDLQDEFNRVKGLIANSRELLSDLRETNDSLLNTKQNEIIKVLTLMAFVFYPATFISSIFTIPASHVPLIGIHNDWWLIMFITAIITGGIWAYFKKKKWL